MQAATSSTKTLHSLIKSVALKKEFWIKEFEEPAFDKDGLPIWIEKHEWDSGGLCLLGRWRVKAYKKMSMRDRLRLEGAVPFGNYPIKRVSADRLVDRFIREGSCRYRRPLGSPCDNFASKENGMCKLDSRICDLLTEKGERYQSQYEKA